MNIIKCFFALLILSQITIKADTTMFDSYFYDKTMRIDYFHIGDSKSEIITVDKIYKYGIWAGSRVHLLDEFNNGKYYIKIYDDISGKLIYSRGFDSYFGEYKTSEWADKGIKRTYHESAIIPFPKNRIKFAVERREKNNELIEIFSTIIDPSDYTIINELVKDPDVKVYKSLVSGDPHSKADIVILGEGYTASEKKKFESDLKKFTDIFFKLEPYKSNKDKFNICGVFKPSAESGVDEPDAGIFKKSVLSCTFSSLGSERYLLTEDNKTMRDLAANVPYDAIYIMVNHKRYGGGGIYNLYCTFTTDNQWHEYLFLHEFGHSFSGLADEYYTSDVAYNEFYPHGIEPVEPNITALLDKDKLKWKEMVTPGIDIPSHWEKEYYDSTDLKWQAERREQNTRIAELKRNGADKKVVAEAENQYNQKDREHNKVINGIIEKSKYYNKVGAFEGAGYASKGLYRPMLDCIMFSKGTKPFCKVCESAIKKVIEHYTE